MKIYIGKDVEDGRSAELDVDLTLRGRLLIQGGSGAGKSYLARLMAERLFGHLPVIVIDVEGEFASLREKFGYVLVGPGGETPADVRSAELLARRLLELRASAVCDLYEMAPRDRHEWVRIFLESLLNAPKNLWQELVVIVDEAHKFCPEKGAGESSASDAMVSLATLGRKRGYGVVFATQRLGKLRKDAAAELQNVLIGRTFIDIDRDRAMDTLGVSKKGSAGEAFSHSLKSLGEGQFWAFGPALTLERTLVQIGRVETSHPKIGSSKRSTTPPPAPERVRALLPKLADLPKQAEDERKSTAELKATIKSLEREVRAAKASAPSIATAPALTEADRNALERLTVAIKAHTLTIISEGTNAKDRLAAAMAPLLDKHSRDCQKIADGAADVIRSAFDGKRIRAVIEKAKALEATPFVVSNPIDMPKASLQPGAVIRAERGAALTVKYGDGDPALGNGGLRRMLVALAQHPKGLTPSQLGVRGKVARTGGSWSTYLSKGRVNGWIVGDAVLRITEAGLVALGPFEPLPAGDDLARHYLAELGNGGASRMLKALIDVYPKALTLDELSTAANVDRNGGSWSTYLSKLRTLDLVTGKAEILASVELFG